MFHDQFSDQTHSQYQSQYTRRNSLPLVVSSSRPCDNFLPSKFHTTMGLNNFQPPPHFLFQSHPPPYSYLPPPPQPPLLPLPVATPRLSCPPLMNQRTNSTGYSLITSKKSNSPSKNPKNQQKNSSKKLPYKDVKKSSPRVLSNNIANSTSGARTINTSLSCRKSSVEYDEQVKLFSDTKVFIISPPPSSLPMPTFSLKPKLINCSAESETRATNNLRQLLQLR